jgi:hypothetical protein
LCLAVSTAEIVYDGGVSTGFVIKAPDGDRRVAWITPPNVKGFRSVSPQADAAVFSTRDQAQLAIDALSPASIAFGTTFVIEPTE